MLCDPRGQGDAPQHALVSAPDQTQNQIKTTKPKTKYLDWPIELINLAKKQEALNAISEQTEALIEELFFHIYRFDEQEITNGNILSLTKQELADGYNLDHNELRYFNVLIKILNNLFY